MADPTGYRRSAPGTQPPYLYPAYRSTLRRAPMRAPVAIPHTLSEITGPAPVGQGLAAAESDLTRQHAGEPIGERMILWGRVVDEDGRAVPATLVELWQCNAAGRYRHAEDQHEAPLDPNFTGAGRALADAEGTYRFVTIKPGAYPWRNQPNAWRPAHIHVSLFGPAFATRLVTQMYFPGDPLLASDPIFNAVPEAAARERMVCALDLAAALPEFALAYRFDIVLRGRAATPLEA